ncbi:MAG: hypothetical protein DHS20C19_30750 [Acidimicrobiales bacterium]|nr:MAG: hypothetical protein DHS20C19_30750 [Acidimicrobiales bacterium]
MDQTGLTPSLRYQAPQSPHERRAATGCRPLGATHASFDASTVLIEDESGVVVREHGFTIT